MLIIAVRQFTPPLSLGQFGELSILVLAWSCRAGSQQNSVGQPSDRDAIRGNRSPTKPPTCVWRRGCAAPETFLKAEAHPHTSLLPHATVDVVDDAVKRHLVFGWRPWHPEFAGGGEVVGLTCPPTGRPPTVFRVEVRR